MDQRVKHAHSILLGLKLIKPNGEKSGVKAVRKVDKAEISNIRKDITQEKDYVKMLTDHRKYEDQVHKADVKDLEAKLSNVYFEIREAELLSRQKD